MSLDAVPSGFSSAAAVTLLKTMRSAQSANSSFIASQDSSTIDARSKSAMSGNLMFSVIAAAANNKATTPASSGQSSHNSEESDFYMASTLVNEDPYFQKDYTIDEAAQNYYAMQTKLVASLRVSGLAPEGQTNGQILADYENFKGQQAADFEAAFDNKTLKVTDASTLRLDAKMTRTYMKSGDGVYGENITASINDAAWMSYLKANPNTIWTDDHCYKGGGGGLIFSW